MVKPLLASVDLAHIPPDLHVYAALYGDLKNAKYLRKQLIEQNQDFEYAFIDSRKIFSTTHALAATFRAINDYRNGRLKTHNVHSEIVLSLNPGNNIAEALRRFGIADSTGSLLIIKVTDRSLEEVAAHLDDAVEGLPLPFNDAELARLQDLGEIRKAYKLKSAAKKQGDQPPDQMIGQDEKRDLELAILGAMALRGT